MFSDPFKTSNEYLQTYLLCLLGTVLLAATCSAFPTVTERLSVLPSGVEIWWWGYHISILVVQDEEMD
jgi:hypothetical protein